MFFQYVKNIGQVFMKQAVSIQYNDPIILGTKSRKLSQCLYMEGLSFLS